MIALLAAAAASDEPLRWSDVAAVVEQLASTAGALAVIGGALWWLLRSKLAEFIRGVREAQQATVDKLAPVADHAATAAAAAGDLAEVRDLVRDVAAWQRRYEREALPTRVALVEVTASNNADRIGALEQAVIRDLADQLRIERSSHTHPPREDTPHDHHPDPLAGR